MKNQYDRISTWFDEHRSRDLFEKKYLDLVINELNGAGSVLDLGCGIGEPIAQY